MLISLISSAFSSSSSSSSSSSLFFFFLFFFCLFLFFFFVFFFFVYLFFFFLFLFFFFFFFFFFIIIIIIVSFQLFVGLLPGGARVGALYYSTSAHVAFHVTEYDDTRAVTRAIETLVVYKGKYVTSFSPIYMTD